jgi:hypothetical protein
LVAELTTLSFTEQTYGVKAAFKLFKDLPKGRTRTFNLIDKLKHKVFTEEKQGVTQEYQLPIEIEHTDVNNQYVVDVTNSGRKCRHEESFEIKPHIVAIDIKDEQEDFIIEEEQSARSPLNLKLDIIKIINGSPNKNGDAFDTFRKGSCSPYKH